MDALAVLPSLSHVLASSLRFQKNHTSKKLRWKKLHVDGGAQLSMLRALPVACFQQLVIGICMSGSETGIAEQDTLHLATCPDLQFSPQSVSVDGVPAHSQFFITYPHSSGLVTLCGNRMTSRGCIRLHDIDFYGVQELLCCIPSLPDKVEILHLYLEQTTRHTPQPTTERKSEVLVHLTAALPQHVKLLIIELSVGRYEEAYLYAESIIGHLQSSQQNTKLWVRDFPWRETPAKLKALAEAHPEYMSLHDIQW